MSGVTVSTSTCNHSGSSNTSKSVSGSVVVVVSIDGFDNEVALKGDMILFKNNDVPGVIGSVGTILSNHNVNIADFSLARNENKEALAVILVDNVVNDTALNELAALDACISVNYARL